MILRLSGVLLAVGLLIGCNNSPSPSMDDFLNEDFADSLDSDPIFVSKQDLENAKVHVIIQDASSDNEREITTDCRFDDSGSPLFDINLPFEINIVYGEVICASQVIGRIEEVIDRSSVLAKR